MSAISYNRLLTILHSQNKCKIVSFVSLQKLHSWVSFNLHLIRRELVLKILYLILLSVFLVALLVVQSDLTKFFCKNIATISCFFLHIQNFHKLSLSFFFVNLILTFKFCGIICTIPIYCKKVVSIP